MDESSIYSCDDHLDLRSVPRELWQARLPKELAERGPRVVTGEGDPMWVCNDRVLGRSGLPRGDKLQVLSAVSRAGIDDDGFRVSNPKLRLEDMDLDGVWASVIYGPIPLTLSIPEPDLQAACYSAWNDWADRGVQCLRSRPTLCPPVPSHLLAGGGGRRTREDRGRVDRGTIMDVSTFDAGDPASDRLSTRRRADRTAAQLPYRGGRFPRLAIRSADGSRLRCRSPSPAARRGARRGGPPGALGAPGSTLVLAEAGVGGCPTSWPMDMEWETCGTRSTTRRRRAERALQTAVIAAFEEEVLAHQYVPHLGAGLVHVGGRLPHTDSTFPESQHAIERRWACSQSGPSKDHGPRLRRALRLRCVS